MVNRILSKVLLKYILRWPGIIKTMFFIDEGQIMIFVKSLGDSTISFAEKYGVTDGLHVLESRLLVSKIILCSK